MCKLLRTVVLSACNGEHPDIDRLQHQLAVKSLREKGCVVSEAIGVYKGTAEQSIVVHLQGPNDVVVAAACAVSYKQESLLVVAADGSVGLVHIEPAIGTTKLGQIVESDSEPDCDYTLLAGKYYHVVQANQVH